MKKSIFVSSLVIGALALLLSLVQKDRPWSVPVSPAVTQPASEKLQHVEKAGEQASPPQVAAEEVEYWLDFPHDSTTYGVEIEESGRRSFLNRSQSALKKAIKSMEDRTLVLDLLDQSANHETILQHYQSLPQDIHFVEEATRVKMLNLLIAALEMTQGEHRSTLQTVDTILKMDASKLGGEGMAKSVAGDQLRLLAALKKYAPAQYQLVAEHMKAGEQQRKLIEYFEKEG